MKINKSQLKQIIKEETEAVIIRENVISDMVDAIKDSGEDVWDWIKDHAEDIKDAAAATGEKASEIADDVAQGALETVDTGVEMAQDVTGMGSGMGSALSRRGKRRHADAADRRAKQKAKNVASSAEWAEDRAADKAAWDQQQAIWDAQAARKERYRDSPEGREFQRRQGVFLRRNVDPEAWDRQVRSGTPSYGEEEDEPEWENLEWGERTDESRKKLKRIVKEELKRFLKNK